MKLQKRFRKVYYQKHCIMQLTIDAKAIQPRVKRNQFFRILILKVEKKLLKHILNICRGNIKVAQVFRTKTEWNYSSEPASTQEDNRKTTLTIRTNISKFLF